MLWKTATCKECLEVGTASTAFLTISVLSFAFAGTGGYQSSGKRDGGGGREAKGATERGGETDEPEPPTRCVSVRNFTCVVLRWTNLNFCPCSHVQLAPSLCPLKKRWKQMPDQFMLEMWVKGQILSDVSRGGGGGGSAVVIRVKQYMWCSEGVQTCADIWDIRSPGLSWSDSDFKVSKRW